jgi:hypothetical protein
VFDGSVFHVLPGFGDRLSQRVADTRLDRADGSDRQPHAEHIVEPLAGPGVG